MAGSGTGTGVTSQRYCEGLGKRQSCPKFLAACCSLELMMEAPGCSPGAGTRQNKPRAILTSDSPVGDTASKALDGFSQ